MRDAQGNVMTTYSSQGSTSDLSTLPLNLSERDLYGSSRLGIYSKAVNVDGGPRDMTDSNTTKYYRGYRQYELTNHLGNVLATVTDKKTGFDTNADGQVNYYDADVTSAQDYYSFGMIMPGRNGYKTQGGWVDGQGSSDNALPSDIDIDNRANNLPPEYTATNSIDLNPGFESGVSDVFSAYIIPDDGSGTGGGSGSSAESGAYRYGFNGKEMDNEVKGAGNQLDYGARIYDPRLGRFLSIDPITKKYPELTPYQFASNTPIQAIDIDGEEGGFYLGSENEQRKREGEAMLKQLDYRNNILAKYPVKETILSKTKEPQNEYERLRQENVNTREFDKVGRNPDGTQKPLTKLASNKTWNNFADNIAIPLLQGATFELGGNALIKGGTLLLSSAPRIGVTVLGKYPEYMELASEIGAKRFNIPPKIWNRMSEIDQWKANATFLERVIKRNDQIILSNPVFDIKKVNGAFRKELDYLIERGYIISPNGTQLLKVVK